MTPSIRARMSLENRVALVTGGAGHIGTVICDALEELGAKIAVADVAGEGKPTTTASRRLAIPVDLRDDAATRRVVPKVVEALGRLDVLIHSAAYVATTTLPGWNVPFAEQSVAAWDEAMRVNLTAAFVLAQEACEPLTRSGHGSIVFISSIYGLVGPDLGLYEGTPMGNPAAYGASKAGLNQLARYLATTYAPAIRANVVAAGGVWRNQHPEFVARYTKRTPLARMANEADVAGAVAFLASDLSGYVTGQSLVVDGGWTAW